MSEVESEAAARRHYPRRLGRALRQRLAERRVVVVAGARQSGKTSLVRELVSPQVEYRTLDDPLIRAVAASDPRGFARHDRRTLIIDEIQRAPDLLPVIKLAVDEDQRPGRFLLTGSADIQALPGTQESLAGRIGTLRLRPLAQGEIEQVSPGFLERAFVGTFASPSADEEGRARGETRHALIGLGLRGGFPEAVALDTQPARRRWHLDYLGALLERDLKDIARIQRAEAMRALIEVLAAWSGRFMDLAAIGAGLGLSRPTIEAYINALQAMFLVERVPAWTRTDYARVGRQPKLYMTDSGLTASILGWRAEQLTLDADRSGKLIEALAFHELAAHVEAGDGAYRLFHYRDREQREIDFVVEREDGALLAIEVKASETVGRNDFKHLRWFKDNLAEGRPCLGLVLHAGESAFSFGDALWAVPFNRLWR